MRRIVLCLLIGSLPIGCLQAQRIDSTASRTLAPGILYRRLVANAGPWTINVVEVALGRGDDAHPALRATDSLRGRETVSSMVRRHSSDSNRIVAAINADFFNLDSGENEDNQVIDGELWKGVELTDSKQDHSHSVRSQFAVSAAGRPLIDRFAFAGRVMSSSGTIMSLEAINARADTGMLVLFTPRFGPTTPRDTLEHHTSEIPLVPLGGRGDTLLFRVAGLVRSGGGTPIGTDAVLAAEGAGRGRLAGLGAPGEILRVIEAFSPARGSIATLLGGWPRLIVHGRSIADSADALEKTSSAFSAGRHPRSGIGFNRDSTTLFLVTVDGRSESSSGMSLVEFANVMLSLGVFEGMNFDGGGSTTMVIDGAVVNKPSDKTGERSVGNALVVVAKRGGT